MSAKEGAHEIRPLTFSLKRCPPNGGLFYVCRKHRAVLSRCGTTYIQECVKPLHKYVNSKRTLQQDVTLCQDDERIGSSLGFWFMNTTSLLDG